MLYWKTLTVQRAHRHLSAAVKSDIGGLKVALLGRRLLKTHFQPLCCSLLHPGDSLGLLLKSTTNQNQANMPDVDLLLQERDTLRRHRNRVHVHHSRRDVSSQRIADDSGYQFLDGIVCLIAQKY